MARPLDPDKRRRLLEASIQVFSREGYRRASVAEIARTAGVAKGGVYSYFASKEDLFAETFLGAFEADRDMLRDALAAGRDPERALRRLFARWSRSSPELEVIVTIFLDFLAECGRDNLRPEVRDRAAGIYVEMRDLVAGLLRVGVRKGTLRPRLDTRAVAQSIMAFWDGLLAGRLVVGEAIDVRRASSAFLRELLRGIRA